MTPIALFTYNRSQNLQRTLDCLKNNKINLLYIFSDGPKSEADEEKVKEVRKILDQIDWVETEKYYQEKNIGLSESVIFGVNKVFEKYDTIICIEDDVCVANGFYEYMNVCLEKYRDNPKIAGVTGLKYPIKEKSFENYDYDIFFYPRFSSWGWGTWKKVWQKNIFNTDVLLSKIEEVKDRIIESGVDMVSMCNSLRTGNLTDSWAVPCSLNMTVNNQYFIYPTRNMIENTGMIEGTHVHSEKSGYELKWSPDINSGKIRFSDQIVLNKQIKNINNLYTLLKNYYTDITFIVTGITKDKKQINRLFANKFHNGIISETTDKPNFNHEKLWLDIDGVADCIIGVHGSNMIIPSALAECIVELLPESRYSNIFQEYLPTTNDDNHLENLYRFRILYGNETLDDISPERIFLIVKSLIDGKMRFRDYMGKEFQDRNYYEEKSDRLKEITDHFLKYKINKITW